MGFEIVAKASASKEFDALPKEVRARFLAAFDLLEDDPFRPRPGLDVRPMSGRAATWRLRVGDHRGIYEVSGGTVRFVRFGHRSRVYG